MSMQCFRCKSPKIMKFIDGFGERRLFCRTCEGSFPERSVKVLDDQKRLNTFTKETYKELGFHN